MQTFGSNNELEIYTADHPWQAMDARLEIFTLSSHVHRKNENNNAR